MDLRPVGHPVAAVAAWVLAWALALAALVVQVAAGVLPAGDDGLFADPTYFALDVVMGLVNGPAAALLLARSRSVVGWIAAAVAIGFAAAALGLALGLLDQQGTLEVPGAGLLGHGFAWFWIPGAFVATTVLPWYLRDDDAHRWARPAAWAGCGLTALVTINVATAQQDGAAANPLAVSGTASGVLAAVGTSALVGLAVLGVLAVAHLVARARDETTDARRALAALAGALGVLVGSFTALTFWPDGAGRDLVMVVAVPVLFAAQVVVPLAIVVLVLRARLWGVDVAVSRAAAWALLTSVVVATYLFVVGVAGRLLPVDDEVAGLFAAAVLALAVQPLRTWLQRRVDRVVYGDDADPVSLLARLGEQVRGTAEPDGTLPALVESLRSGLRLGGVEVLVREAPYVGAVAGDTGATRATGSVEIPLVVEHREIGALVLRPTPGTRLDLRTIRVARHLSDVVAVSLDLAQANHRLREASRRLGEVRHEERRLLRRELHDGLGPSLAGVGLGLAAARRRVTHDVPGTVELLVELEAELARRGDDVRLLARSLLPAQLDDGDLAEALAVLSARFGESGLAVDTRCSALDHLDTRRQVAIYHVAAEAVLNAYRHAGADRVSVTVAATGDGVALDVTDDGVGVDPTAAHGVGLRSMRERADELGGTLTVAPGPSGRGTRVRLVLP